MASSSPTTADPLVTERVVAQIAAAPILTLDGRAARLRELWKGHPTVTTFVRHFGCLFCHQMVHDLVTRVPEIIARGARVVIVGNGSLAQARHFFSLKKLPRDGVDVVTDPERESYRAAGFERSLGRTLINGGSIRAYGEARSQGHRVTGLFGDLTQLGGILVVRPPAMLLYMHRSRFAGDHPNLDEALATLPPR